MLSSHAIGNKIRPVKIPENMLDESGEGKKQEHTERLPYQSTNSVQKQWRHLLLPGRQRYCSAANKVNEQLRRQKNTTTATTTTNLFKYTQKMVENHKMVSFWCRRNGSARMPPTTVLTHACRSLNDITTLRPSRVTAFACRRCSMTLATHSAVTRNT